MLTIRHVTPRDIIDLRAMIAKLCAFHGDPCHLGLAEAQRRFIGGPLCALIARDGAAPAGYAVLEPRWRPMERGDCLDIAHLFVEERVRGRGIGRALIAAARDHAAAQGATRMTIGTAATNVQAAAAYRAMGLEEIKVTHGPKFDITLN